MIKEWVTVVSWQNGEALLHCDVKASCHRCASRQGCGTRIWNKLGPRTSHLLSVPVEQPLVAGQKVELGIAQGSLSGCALLVYISPLAGLFLCSGLFQALFGTDLAAMGGALLGGVSGFLFARGFSRRFSRREGWQPVILSIALSPEAVRVDASAPPTENP